MYLNPSIPVIAVKAVGIEVKPSKKIKNKKNKQKYVPSPLE